MAGNLSSKDIENIQSIWNTLMQDATSTGKLLMKNLFESYPDSEKFFSQYAEEGKGILENPRFEKHITQNVLNQFTKLINNLSNESEVNDWVSKIARIHKPKGVGEKEFKMLGLVILSTMKGELAEKFSGEVAEAWEKFIENLMSSITKKMPS